MMMVVEKMKTKIKKFYGSNKWRKKSIEIISRDKKKCQFCRNGDVPLSVHHWIPIKDRWDLRLDDANLITLCKKCHVIADKVNGMYRRGIMDGIRYSVEVIVRLIWEIQA